MHLLALVLEPAANTTELTSPPYHERGLQEVLILLYLTYIFILIAANIQSYISRHANL